MLCSAETRVVCDDVDDAPVLMMLTRQAPLLKLRIRTGYAQSLIRSDSCESPHKMQWAVLAGRGGGAAVGQLGNGSAKRSEKTYPAPISLVT